MPTIPNLLKDLRVLDGKVVRDLIKLPIDPPKLDGPFKLNAAELPGRILRLHDLHCHCTETWSGPDKAYLKVTIDGVPTSVRLPGPADHWSINDDEAVSVGLPIPFFESIRLVLWDDDSPDGDDNLGGKLLNKQAVGSHSVKFTQDGADYTLTCDVVNPGDAGLAEVKRLLLALGIDPALVGLTSAKSGDAQGNDGSDDPDVIRRLNDLARLSALKQDFDGMVLRDILAPGAPGGLMLPLNVLSLPLPIGS